MERLNITLEDEHAEKLARLADRMHLQPGTIARSLLASAIDDADPDARTVTALLDGIPGALDRAQLGHQQARDHQTLALEQL
jgi:adenylate kinase family enzyme